MVTCDNYIIGINDIQSLLIDESSEDVKAFFDLLKNTCEEWSKEKDIEEEWGRSAKPFHIILQYDERDKEVVKSRFDKYVDFSV